MGISVRNLVKTYGSATVIKDLSFEVADGEFVTLLGPSGCGKTTTLRAIAGLDTIDGGEIHINHQVVSSARANVFVPPNARNLGMVFQSYAIWPHMTVSENVAFPLTVRGHSNTTEPVKRALGIVGLSHLADRRPSELSGGQQQRVALARAIAGDPQVLLFDEPLSNLDARLRDRTRLEISRIQRELNVPAVYVTHDQIEALSMSDRIIVMEGGQMMQEGPPKDIYQKPVNRFVADFIGSANFLKVSRVNQQWQLADGHALEVNPESETDIELPKFVLVRPEAVRIEAPDTQAVYGAAMNRLAGTVLASVFLGQHNEHIIRIADTTLRAQSRQTIPPGTEIMISFSAQDCRLVNDNA